jgi:Tol biopolymer transport system component
LEKEPSNRFQSAADVSFALAAVADAATSVSVTDSKPAMWSKWVILATLAAILAIAGDYWVRRHVTRNANETNAVLTRLTTDSGLTTDGAISSDGKFVAFASDRASADNLDIWVKQRSGLGAFPFGLQPIPQTITTQRFRPTAPGSHFVPIERGRHLRNSGFRRRSPLTCFSRKAPAFFPGSAVLDVLDRPREPGVPSGPEAQLFVQPISGGPPMRVGAGCKSIDSTAVWSPDSQHVLFEGLCDGQRTIWIFRLNGNLLQPREELYQYLSRNSFLVSALGPAYPAFLFHEWLGGPSRLLLSGFSARALSIADAVSISSVPISEDGMRVTGERQNLTFGTEPEYRASAASNGRMVLSSVSTNSQIWSLPIDEAGKATGEPVRLTVEAWSGAPTLSRDGETLAFQPRRGEGWEIHSMSVRTGKQISVCASARPTYGQVINWTGTTIAYVLSPEQGFSLWQVGSSGGLPQKLWNRDFYPTDWSPDSRFLLGELENGEVRMLDLQTRTDTTLLKDTGRELYQAHLSNDANWPTFIAVSGTHSQVYVAPFRKALVPKSDWIPVTDGTGWDDKPHFS